MTELPDFDKVHVQQVQKDCTFMLAPLTSCKYENFEASPQTVEYNGYKFEKRSWIFDGVVYWSGTPTLERTESLQNAIGSWTRSVFTTATPADIVQRVVQEAEELVEAVSFHPPEFQQYTAAGMDSPVAVKKAIGSEVADVVHCLIDLCAVLGIDFDAVCREKLEINKKRVWSEPDEKNQRYHIKNVEAN